MATSGEMDNNLRYLLERAAEKHCNNQEFATRCRRAADIISPRTHQEHMTAPHYPLYFRQGEMASAPGHIEYWIRSSEKYHTRPNDAEHKAPPYYQVRLGANGDNHSCTCPDFANGAPTLHGKKYCKHVIIAFAFEYLRDHPEPLGTPAGLQAAMTDDPVARAEFIKHPQRFVDAMTAA